MDLDELGYQGEISETGKTFKENAYIKAREIALKYQLSVIADDSGLEVEALNGAPGIYSARYAGPTHDTAANNALLIKNMQGIQNRSAKFVCAICIYHADHDYRIIEESCTGWILEEPRGNQGFGYDPYFYVEGFQKTFAELSLDEKNQISHRAKALRRLKEICNEDLSFK